LNEIELEDWITSYYSGPVLTVSTKKDLLNVGPLVKGTAIRCLEDDSIYVLRESDPKDPTDLKKYWGKLGMIESFDETTNVWTIKKTRITHPNQLFAL
jgi:hypothetical protein